MKRFVGGPWDGYLEPLYTPVPSQEIKVYDEPLGNAAVCADEQVVRLLGWYERRPLDGPPLPGTIWSYDWHEIVPSA